MTLTTMTMTGMTLRRRRTDMSFSIRGIREVSQPGTMSAARHAALRMVETRVVVPLIFTFGCDYCFCM